MSIKVNADTVSWTLLLIMKLTMTLYQTWSSWDLDLLTGLSLPVGLASRLEFGLCIALSVGTGESEITWRKSQSSNKTMYLFYSVKILYNLSLSLSLSLKHIVHNKPSWIKSTTCTQKTKYNIQRYTSLAAMLDKNKRWSRLFLMKQ